MRRGSWVAFKCRNVAEPGVKVELIPLYSVWLKMLNVSQRNSKPAFSRIAKFLKRPKSKLKWSGKLRALRPRVPKVSPWGAAKAAGLKASGPRLELGDVDAPGLPTKSGRALPPLLAAPFATPALSVFVNILKGMPVCATVMPETCQPPKTLWAMPAPLKSGME